jgi:UPF0716 family protein affecting phage T7 exclusion
VGLECERARGVALVRRQSRYACTSAENEKLESADGAGSGLELLVVVVLVAVVEVLVPGVVAGVLRSFALSTSPRRRLAPTSGETAPDRACTHAAVSVMRMAVPS